MYIMINTLCEVFSMMLGPVNQVAIPINQVTSPINQVSSPKNQVSSPKNQVFIFASTLFSFYLGLSALQSGWLEPWIKTIILLRESLVQTWLPKVQFPLTYSWKSEVLFLKFLFQEIIKLFFFSIIKRKTRNFTKVPLHHILNVIL